MKKGTSEKKSTSQEYIGIFPFQFDDGGASDDAVALPRTIQILPIGQWEHPSYGPILVTAADVNELVQNFNAGIRKGVYITAGHEGYQELPAVAWITSVEARGDGLWGTPEWNDLGRDILGDKQYKFFSPEFYPEYEDPETHQLYHNVLTGGALTKSPYFKELQAIVFSEPKLKKQFSTMDLKDLLAKKVEELNDEEKAFMKAHASELTEEQKAEFTAIIDAPESDEEKEAREKKEADDKAATDKAAQEQANVDAGLNVDGSAKVSGSEKFVHISASEYAVLKSAADKGALAFKELETKKLTDAVAALTFSQSNKSGKFLPKDKDSLQSFMELLNPGQRLAFSTLVAKLPTSQIFDEKGASTTAASGNAVAEVDAKINAKMKADDKLSYSQALKLVMSEEKGLEERYDSELPSARKGKE